MYSSPGTPAGTGRSAASSTYIRVFHTGRPIGTGPSPVSSAHGQYVTSTAASVGPYRLCSGTSDTERKRARSSAERASPLQNTRRSPLSEAADGSRRNTSSIDGTKCRVVTPARRTVSAR